MKNRKAGQAGKKAPSSGKTGQQTQDLVEALLRNLANKAHNQRKNSSKAVRISNRQRGKFGFTTSSS